MGYQSQPTHGPQYPWFLFIPFIRFKGFTAIHQEKQDFMGEALKKLLSCAPVSEQTLQVHV